MQTSLATVPLQHAEVAENVRNRRQRLVREAELLGDENNLLWKGVEEELQAGRNVPAEGHRTGIARRPRARHRAAPRAPLAGPIECWTAVRANDKSTCHGIGHGPGAAKFPMASAWRTDPNRNWRGFLSPPARVPLAAPALRPRACAPAGVGSRRGVPVNLPSHLQVPSRWSAGAAPRMVSIQLVTDFGDKVSEAGNEGPWDSDGPKGWDSAFAFPADALSSIKVSLSLVAAEDPKAATAPSGAAGLLRVWQDRRLLCAVCVEEEHLAGGQVARDRGGGEDSVGETGGHPIHARARARARA